LGADPQFFPREPIMDDPLRLHVLALIRQAKEKPAGRASALPVFQFGRKLAWLEPVTQADVKQSTSVTLLGRWSRQLLDEGGKASIGTADGQVQDILETSDRLLFWVKDLDGMPIGTLGLGHFDFADGRVEVRDMVRGVPGVLPGLMYCAVQTLVGWAFQTLGVKETIVRVASENARAIRLCERSGFRRGSDGGTVVMILSRADWMAAHRLDKAA
jgi:hypothetical protein